MDGSREVNWKRSGNSRGLDGDVSFRDSRHLPRRDRIGSRSRDRLIGDQNDNLDNQIGSSRACRNEAANQEMAVTDMGEISLRQWLDRPERSVDLLECLHIFRQIVEIVDLAHSQGIVVNNVRPSCFVMSSFNRVSFIKSTSCSTSGSDSFVNVDECKSRGGPCSFLSPKDLSMQRHMWGGKIPPSEVSQCDVRQRDLERSFLQTNTCFMRNTCSLEERGETNGDEHLNMEEVQNKKKSFPQKQILLMEFNWYTTPEDAAGDSNSFASDIYRLGVLLFELFCSFSSMEEKLTTMSNLRHRVLPPQLLLKWPKEASFCLWLLHPQPNTRPKMSEVLKSEFLNEPRDNQEEREAAIKLREEIEEQELLLEFLLQMQQKKKEVADKLDDTICCLSTDINEVLKQQSILKRKGNSSSESNTDDHSAGEKVHNLSSCTLRNENFGSRKRFRAGVEGSNEEECSEQSTEGQKALEHPFDDQESILSKSGRLMKNFEKLESAYFSTRGRLMKPTGKLTQKNSMVGSVGRGSVVQSEVSSVNNLSSKEVQSEVRRSGWINPFLEGLCKYLSFSNFKVRADLKQGDLLNSSNLVCALGFDRDKEFFATAGVNKKIKVFECNAILNEDRDIHYPVIEMGSRSKFSSISWNSYVKSQIASSDFEGLVQVWDVTRGQVCMEMREHEKRVWSVDFSQVDPTKLASGSDDGAVKLWSINQAILFLYLVDVSFETKRRKCWYYQNKGEYMLSSVSS